VHESAVNPDPAYAHPVQAGIPCTGCHHKVENVTDPRGFRACSQCHGPDGHPDNPEDRDGVELSKREISHRACISCHLAVKKTDTEGLLFKTAPYTRCGECHMPGLEPPAEAAPSSLIAEVFPSMPAVETPSAAVSPIPVPDRWRFTLPEDARWKQARWFDPYHQNPIKGDLPLRGTHLFATVGVESESIVNPRRLTGSIDAGNQGTNLFERGDQFAFRQNILVSFDLSSRGTSFRPAAWRISIAPAFNFNLLDTQRNGIVNIDPGQGDHRAQVDATLQTAFSDVRLGDTPVVLPFLESQKGIRGNSPSFDSTTLRVGLQPFLSDFRGFIFNDVNLGARFFGNALSNRYQFNLAAFRMLEKNVNSELNTLRMRHQTVIAANLYRQDTWRPGYTMALSLHYNHDQGSPHVDENGFETRPGVLSGGIEHQVNAVYLGWAGDGHLGRLNLTHAVYQVLGTDSRNPISGRSVTINAQMAAIGASVTKNWFVVKSGFLFASGDKSPTDGTARGFDSILDTPEFAGGRFSFWNQQGLRLIRTGANLVNQSSLFPSLRTNKFAGQANFVNPGLIVGNAGVEGDITTRIRLIANFNYLRFHHTEPLSVVTGIGGIDPGIGLDTGFGLRIRPWLTENMVVEGGYSFLVAGNGLRQIYGGASQAILNSAFIRLRLVY
jgi:hypothetical protein